MVSTVSTLNQTRNIFSKNIRLCHLNYFKNQYFGNAISKHFLFNFDIICETIVLSEEAFINKFLKDRNKEHKRRYSKQKKYYVSLIRKIKKYKK